MPFTRGTYPPKMQDELKAAVSSEFKKAETSMHTIRIIGNINCADTEAYSRTPADMALPRDPEVEERRQESLKKLSKTCIKAIKNIDNGTYGICESCEQLIDPRRLAVRPSATKCVPCKTKEDEDRKEQTVRYQGGAKKSINLNR